MRQRNPAYYSLQDSDKRYQFVYGGAGSGKSVFVAQEEVQESFGHEDQKTLLIRKVKADVRDSNFAQVKKELEKSNLLRYVHIRRQEMRITYPSGAEMLGLGLDDPQRIKSIEGPTRIWIEEANEITEEDFDMLDLRLRGSKDVPFQITMTFNPNMPKQHWIRKRFFDGQNPKDRDDIFVLRTTWRDNWFIDSEYINVLSRLSGELKDIYKHGKFVDRDHPMQVIKSEWVDAAFQRDPSKMYGKPYMGVDVARGGADRTTKARMSGNVLVELREVDSESTTTTASNILTDINDFGILPVDVAVDTVGLGGGTADSLKDHDVEITPFIAGASPVQDEIQRESFFQFNNLRSQAWWYMRERLQRGEIAFAIDEDSAEAERLREDLTAPKYRTKGEKEIEVEPKDGRSDKWGLKQRLGRSTDEGDAVIEANMVHRMGNRVDYTKPLAAP
jgi:hypothetical protein